MPSEDPVLHSSRREAWIILALSAAALAYTLGYCYAFGYTRSAESLTFVLGFPDWVFWGILIPWGICLLFSSIFALGFMRDENLEAAATESGERRDG